MKLLQLTTQLPQIEVYQQKKKKKNLPQIFNKFLTIASQREILCTQYFHNKFCVAGCYVLLLVG